MKKILINLLLIFSLFWIVSISTKVEAAEKVNTGCVAIDIYGNEVRDFNIHSDSLFLSLYDYLFEGFSPVDRLNMFSQFSYFDKYIQAGFDPANFEYYLKCRDEYYLRSGYDDLSATFNLPFLYIPSEFYFNLALRNYHIISSSETYLDVKGDNSLSSILDQVIIDGYAYIISKANVPFYLYQEVNSFDPDDLNLGHTISYYDIDESYHLSVIDGYFYYEKDIVYDDYINYEPCDLELPNSIGVIESVSPTKVKYTYNLLKYEKLLGYYYLKDDELFSIEFDISFCPDFLFDTVGNLRTISISVRDGTWFEPKVHDVNKKIKNYYYIDREYYYPVVSTEISMFYIFAAYFRFTDQAGNTLNFDTIEKIVISYEIYLDTFWDRWQHNWFGTEYKKVTYTCTLTKSDKVTNPDEFVQWFIRNTYSTDLDKENLASIQKGDYLKEYNGKTYNFQYKVYLNNDTDGSYAHTEYWKPTQELQILDIVVTYKGVLYDLTEIEDIPILPNPTEDDHGKENCTNISKNLFDKLKKLFKESVFFKIIVIVIGILLFVLLFVWIRKLVLLIKQNRQLKQNVQEMKKKNKT